MTQEAVPVPIRWRAAWISLAERHREWLAREMRRRGLDSPSPIFTSLIDELIEEEGRAAPPIEIELGGVPT